MSYLAHGRPDDRNTCVARTRRRREKTYTNGFRVARHFFTTATTKTHVVNGTRPARRTRSKLVCTHAHDDGNVRRVPAHDVYDARFDRRHVCSHACIHDLVIYYSRRVRSQPPFVVRPGAACHVHERAFVYGRVSTLLFLYTRDTDFPVPTRTKRPAHSVRARNRRLRDTRTGHVARSAV